MGFRGLGVWVRGKGSGFRVQEFWAIRVRVKIQKPKIKISPRWWWVVVVVPTVIVICMSL